MRLPRFRLRTLIIAVAVAAVILGPLTACLGWLRWLHAHNAWISVNGLTIHF